VSFSQLSEGDFATDFAKDSYTLRLGMRKLGVLER
jgi:hypothetical protein